MSHRQVMSESLDLAVAENFGAHYVEVCSLDYSTSTEQTELTVGDASLDASAKAGGSP